MSLMHQVQHEADMKKLNEAIERTLVHLVATETTAEGDELDIFMVVLDDKEIGLLKHGISRDGGRPTSRPVWRYKFASKGWWGLAPNKKSAINSIVHRELFA